MIEFLAIALGVFLGILFYGFVLMPLFYLFIDIMEIIFTWEDEPKNYNIECKTPPINIYTDDD